MIFRDIADERYVNWCYHNVYGISSEFPIFNFRECLHGKFTLK